MKAENLTKCAELLHHELNNILVIESKDEYNRQLIFSTLMKELKERGSKLYSTFYYWDDYVGLKSLEVKDKKEAINYKLFKKIFNYKPVKMDMVSVKKVFEKLEQAMSVGPSFIQFHMDNGLMMNVNHVSYIKTFLRHVASDKNTKLSEDLLKDAEMYNNAINPDKLNCKKKSVFCIITNDLSHFEDIEDIAILCRLSMSDDRHVEKTLDLLKDTKHSKETISEVKEILSPINLSQLISFVSHVNLKKVTDKKVLIAEAKDYLHVCLENEELVERLPSEHGFEYIGGYEAVKNRVRNNIINVWKNREKADKYGIQYENGIVLFGAPGIGKTAMVSCIAAELKVPAYRLNIAKILDKFVGETEKKLYNIFKLIEKTTSILFIDELDSIGSSRENGMQSVGNKVDRNVINLLLQYISDPKRKSLVVGATNLIYEIDQALMRKGRLGTKIYIPYPNEEERKHIVKIHLDVKRKIPHSVDIDIAAKLTDMFTGAEIESLINETSIDVLLNQNKEKVTDDYFRKAITEFHLPPNRKDDIEKHNYLAKMFSSFAIPGITDKSYGMDMKGIRMKGTPPTLGEMMSN